MRHAEITPPLRRHYASAASRHIERQLASRHTLTPITLIRRRHTPTPDAAASQ